MEIKSLLASVSTIAQERKMTERSRMPFKIMTVTVELVLSVCSITTISQCESESALYHNYFLPICVQFGLLR